MESPTKVITAFIGVFVAGAVFGGFFSLGIGARWRAIEAPPSPQAAAVAPPSAPGAAVPAKAITRTKAATATHRAQLLQVPTTWQAPMLMRRYAERLDLTSDQKQRILPLLQRATEDYRRVQQNTFRETAIILQRLQQDLAKELTPEQRKTLIDMEAKQREAVRKMEERQRERKAINEKRLKAAPATAPAPVARPASTPGSAETSAPAAVPTTSEGSPTATTVGNTTTAPEKHE